MAKFEGTQNIPAEWLDLYRATITEGMPTGVVRKRFPYRLRLYQKGGYKVSEKQKEQRERFLNALQKFKTLSDEEKSRWWENMPPWGSYLWYYNYFIMSALIGNANIKAGGAGVIKSIQVHKGSCPTTGGKEFSLSPTVDPAKTVVMLSGSARKVPRVIRGSATVSENGSTHNIGDTVDPDKCTVRLMGTGMETSEQAAWNCYPIVTNLTSTQISIGWSEKPHADTPISWEITEHVEGLVEPVLVSVAADKVTVDWAEVPDAAADVSVIVIEYI